MTKERISEILHDNGAVWTSTAAEQICEELKGDLAAMIETLCNHYCRFPYIATVDDLPGICETCPLWRYKK